jgi:hypothetical protein
MLIISTFLSFDQGFESINSHKVFYFCIKILSAITIP